MQVDASMVPTEIYKVYERFKYSVPIFFELKHCEDKEHFESNCIAIL